MKLALAVSLAVAVVVVIASCNAVLGIDEKSLQSGSALSCDAYCAEVMADCTGAQQLYASQATCLETCALLPLGDRADPTGNTIACRLHRAELAVQTGEQVDVYCSSAGPAGRGVCGDDCEIYCDLVAQVCSPLPAGLATRDDCLATCAGVPTLATYSKASDGTNSLECRLFHTTNASLDPETHCAHAEGLTLCVPAP